MAVRQIILGLFLSAFALATLAFGVYANHYYALYVFTAWFCFEWLVLKHPWKKFFAKNTLQARRKAFYFILSLLPRTRLVSSATLHKEIENLKSTQELPAEDARWLENFKALIEAENLVNGVNLSPKEKMRRHFWYPKTNTIADEIKWSEVDLSEVASHSGHVALMMSQLSTLSRSKERRLRKAAKKVMPLTEAQREKIQTQMTRDYGLPFLILNLIAKNQLEGAKLLMQKLMMTETLQSMEFHLVIFWMSEILAFNKDGEVSLTDFDTVIQHLYHLCLTNPDRGGFLEVDSRFYSQFQNVSELAQEALLFREELVEKTFQMWEAFDGLFDEVFSLFLEQITRTKNKALFDRRTWLGYWRRQKTAFNKDYLLVIQGNISFSEGHFEEAAYYYEQAIALTPHLRAACLNLPFAYALADELDNMQIALDRILDMKELGATALLVAGHVNLLIEHEATAEGYYEEVRALRAWEQRTDFYISTFCYEFKRYEQALTYAEKALELSPNDSSVRFHLSLCFSALGKSKDALEALKAAEDAPEWLKYYRFTLERDAGQEDEALNTLLNISSDYFQDPNELEQALEFARHTQDLSLLRHLKRKD